MKNKSRLKIKRAVIITAEGFEDEEVIYPIIRLKEEDFEVHVATKDQKAVNGRLNFPLELLVRYYGTLVDSTKLNTKDYDLVLIPGGFEAPDRVRQIPQVLQFVKEMYNEKKIVAAFCHGPWVLISAKLINGKRVTGYIGIADDLRNAGAIYINEPVVTDGNIITSRHPRDIGVFMKEILSKFKNEG